jgi:hypothetical protein
MKKLLFSGFCGGLIAIFSCSPSFTQEIAYHSSSRTNNSAMSALRFNTKWSSAFNRQLENAYDVSWMETKEKFYVRFMQNGLQNQALLDRKGELIYQFSYGTEKDLPADIRKMVKREYYDQNITLVHTISQDGRTIYVVTLEDNSEIIKVMVENMEMAETQRITKNK